MMESYNTSWKDGRPRIQNHIAITSARLSLQGESLHVAIATFPIEQRSLTTVSCNLKLQPSQTVRIYTGRSDAGPSVSSDPESNYSSYPSVPADFWGLGVGKWNNSGDDAIIRYYGNQGFNSSDALYYRP